MRPNELHDSFASFLSDVCHDVEIELRLQPLQGETTALKLTTDDDARLDINANALWEPRSNKTYFNVKVFNRWQKVALKTVAKPTSTINLLKRTNMDKEQLRLRKQRFVRLSLHALVALRCNKWHQSSLRKKRTATLISYRI